VSNREGAPLSVLRICSVFQPPPELALDRAAAFDPIGGMQTHTAELTGALDALGMEQVVVTTRPPGSPQYQQVGTRARVVRVGWPVRRFRQLWSLPAARQVLRAAPTADLVHVHLGEDLAAVPLGMAASWRSRLPLVLTVHCSLAHTFTGSGLRGLLLRTLGASLERLGMRRASGVIVLTERLARAVAGQTAPRRLRVIPSGVNPDAFRGPFEDPLEGVARPRVLFVGRLAEQKGVLDLIRAVPLIRSQARVVLVGDGPARRAVEEETGRLGVQDRVLLTGFVHHRHVPSYLRNADVLVLPSRYEELGSVLLEAMHAGLPIVATRTGGIPEVIRHGENGLLCEPGDPHGLAAAIDRVLSDGELARALSAEAESAARRYGWPALAERVLDLYREVAAERRGFRMTAHPSGTSPS
jgi:glycogen(starch) synthase